MPSSATAKANWHLTKEKPMSAGQSSCVLRAVYIEQWCRVASQKHAQWALDELGPRVSIGNNNNSEMPERACTWTG